MSNDAVDAGTSTVRGGPLLTLREAAKFTDLPLEALLDNPFYRLHPVPIGKRFYCFEDDLLELLALLEARNP